MIARYFCYLVAAMLGVSAYFNYALWKTTEQQQKGNLILASMIMNPLVELAVNEQTGHVLVRVNSTVVKEFYGVCPPQKRL